MVNGENLIPKLIKSTDTGMKNIPGREFDDEVLPAVPAIPCG
jgi:hypothetical protein